MPSPGMHSGGDGEKEENESLEVGEESINRLLILTLVNMLVNTACFYQRSAPVKQQAILDHFYWLV